MTKKSRKLLKKETSLPHKTNRRTEYDGKYRKKRQVNGVFPGQKFFFLENKPVSCQDFNPWELKLGSWSTACKMRLTGLQDPLLIFLVPAFFNQTILWSSVRLRKTSKSNNPLACWMSKQTFLKNDMLVLWRPNRSSSELKISLAFGKRVGGIWLLHSQDLILDDEMSCRCMK